MNVKISGRNVLNIMRFFDVCLSNVHHVRKVNYYRVVLPFGIMVEHRKKSWNMLENIIRKIEHLHGKILDLIESFFSSSNRIFRSYSNTRTVAPVISRPHRSPGSTIKTSDTVESVRHSRSQPVDHNDNYQQVYHDDSSTHGSRTLDSRFSRDKYDLSDEQNTDDDEDELIQKASNGASSPTHVYRSSEPFHVDENHIAQIQHPMDQIDKGKYD